MNADVAMDSVENVVKELLKLNHDNRLLRLKAQHCEMFFPQLREQADQELAHHTEKLYQFLASQRLAQGGYENSSSQVSSDH